MNRKMRAKANNQAARAKRDRAPCPMAGKIIPGPANHCDKCSDELAVALVVVDEIMPDKRSLN